MRLRHSHDRYYDLTAQLEQLSRDTTEMFLETLGSIPIVGNGIFNDMQYMTELDWTDETHTLTISYVPTGNGVTEHTKLNILIQLAEKTSVEVAVYLAHVHKTYVHYAPIGWEITVINAGQLIDDFHATWGITAAMLRQLIIQREIANNIAKDKAKNCFHLGLYDFTKKNMTRSSEEIHVKWGVRHLIDDIYRAYDPSYTGPELIIQL